MSRIFRIGTALAVIAFSLATVSAVAQQPGQGRGRGGFPGGGFGGSGGIDHFTLLGSEEVQKELEILDDQKTQITKLGDERRESMRAGFQGFGDLRNLPEEERRKKFDEMRKQGEAKAQEFNKKLVEVLLPHQMDRLQEISLQVRGPGALGDPQVAGKLGLSDDQREQLAKIQEESRQQFQGLFQRGGDNDEAARQAAREKMDAARKATAEKTMAVLTSEQKAQFEKMQGKKIELDRSKLFQRGPGGGQSGRRPGNNN